MYAVVIVVAVPHLGVRPRDMSSYRVHLIVDREAAELLRVLPIGEPAWIVDSPGNHEQIAELRRVRPFEDHLTGVTAFRDDPSAGPERLAIRVLGEIDLHHGEYSHEPPYSTLRVIGARQSAELLSEAAEFGLTRVRGEDSDFELYRAEMAEQDAAPNSHPPSPFPTSSDVQAPDSLRTPFLGGCG